MSWIKNILRRICMENIFDNKKKIMMMMMIVYSLREIEKVKNWVWKKTLKRFFFQIILK